MKKIGGFFLQILAAIVIAAINPISCIVLQKLAALSRRKTMPEETYQGMILTLITQYLLIALVIYLVNLTFPTKAVNALPEGMQGFIRDLPFFNG